MRSDFAGVNAAMTLTDSIVSVCKGQPLNWQSQGIVIISLSMFHLQHELPTLPAGTVV